ncbi:Hephaestin [Gracilariopsis chorda]|uniref:Hephaestin n=1 Tax=Gracilariopsis chorda TaxID=448386 RepID=A0A2V3J1J7_9FLOR|nr:Hephaestin [Gracilariopsis chorda]|eukprot:PXF48219.1 Hephaestin [Gracilariopsis chorda]
MHYINGRVFCALPAFEMQEGGRTRLYHGTVGNEVDLHTAHVHGLVGVTAGGEHVDSILLFTSSTAVVEIVPDNIGVWLFHFHVNDRLHASMQALLSVRPAATGPAKRAKAVSSFVPNRRRC